MRRRTSGRAAAGRGPGGAASLDEFFPYGRAPLALLALAAVSGLALLALDRGPRTERPDLVFTLFASNHLDAYREAIAEFEAERGVRIDMQLVHAQAQRSRLQSAMMTGAPVPDLVENVAGSMGFFTRGPLEEVGFLDLTDRLHATGLYDRIVASRFSLWSSRGRIFALPHDVHPVMLCYRRDLVEDLGIDVASLTTWDAFARVGREVTADLDGDGHPDRYMLHLDPAGTLLPTLLLQRGVGLFDAQGRVAFDSPEAEEVVLWHLRQCYGPGRIAFGTGGGQAFVKAMYEGLCLFTFCPDWMSKVLEMMVPDLGGRLALVPLPAWEPGGRRTSTWGGTGLSITRACRDPELAWDLAVKLYFREEDLGKRFAASNIIPPLRSAWDLPAFREPRPFFSRQPIGTLFAGLAPDAPPDYASPYTELARAKLNEAYLRAAGRYQRRGEDGLRACVRAELRRGADYVRRAAGRNVFLREGGG